MKEQFETYNFTQKSLDRIALVDAIITSYRADYDMSLTLRQIHYYLVSNHPDEYENTQRNYKNLGNLVTKGRMAGLLDWDGVHDEGRGALRVYGKETERAVIRGVSKGLILNPWRDQDTYVEVWVEKHGMAGTIKAVCNKHRVTYLTCGGYVSASEAYEAAGRYDRAVAEGKHPVLIHLGDHDPSGLDMTRDNHNRITKMSTMDWGDLDVRRIALNYDQIDEYNPPPNPAKMTDTRADDYIAEHGYSSWELDALPPRIIREILDDAIVGCITDPDAYQNTFDREREGRDRLDELYNKWGDISRFMEAHDVDRPGVMGIVDEILGDYS